ncbi:MAG: Dickkopf N-terminal cysteine-rich domain-containing protein [bacterium]
MLPLGGVCGRDDRACAEGLTCIGGFCFARSGDGGDCDGSADCDGQLYCRQYSLDGQALAVGICSARTAEGEACHRRNFGCVFPLTCLDDVCVPRSAEGGLCLTTGDCDATTWCDLPDGDRGTCQPFIPEDGACEARNSGCSPGLVCLDGACQARQPMGEGCQSAADCLPDQYCDRRDDDGNPRQAGICMARALRGEACDARESSVCRQSRCLGGVCAADQPVGGVCDSAFDCADGLWCPQP